MTQQDKDLLLHDLSARLPYGVKCQTKNGIGTLISIECSFGENLVYVDFDRSEAEEYDLNDGDTVKPYLRPMSSMTEEEEKEIRMLHHCFYREGNGWITAGVFGTNDCGCTVFEMADILNYLNAHHFDYRGLIEKGLALEAKEGMYNKN